jgi:hypothetical protein
MAAVVALQAPGSCGGGVTRPLNLLTRDEGEVVILCKDNGTIEAPAAFLVSRNSDDDERHRPDDRDRGRSSLHALENNLRPLRFRGETRAVTVEVAAPVDATGKAQEGRRVRSWKEPFAGGRFDFTARHPLPATLNIEGKEKSRGEDDTVYRFVFYDAAGAGVCEGQLPGTVVLVEAKLLVTGGGAPDRNRKLLILGVGRTEATLTPAVALDPEWHYPGGSTFSDPHALATDFTADSLFTPTMDRDTLRLVLTSRHGQKIVAHRPLNLTGPRAVTVKTGGSFTRETPGWLDANQGTFSLFHETITYTMRDQFAEPIRESAYGGATPQIRENIGNVLQSGIGTVAAWIATQLQWTQAWRDKPAGEFTDLLRIQEITKDVIRRAVMLPGGGPAGRYEFDPILQAGGSMTQAAPSHIWYLTVNRREGTAIRVEATHNAFDVTAFQTQPAGGGIQIRLRSRYEVHTP